MIWMFLGLLALGWLGAGVGAAGFANAHFRAQDAAFDREMNYQGWWIAMKKRDTFNFAWSWGLAGGPFSLVAVVVAVLLVGDGKQGWHPWLSPTKREVFYALERGSGER